MTKRRTPATTTAIGVITVALLAAGGSRLLSPTAATAAATATTTGTISLDHPLLPPDSTSTAVVSVSGGPACSPGALGALTPTSATLSSRGASGGPGGSLFSTTGQAGSWKPSVQVSLTGAQGSGQALVQASSTPGVQYISATFSGGSGVPLLGNGSCSGTSPDATLTEVGAPASVTLAAPNPARLLTSAPGTTATVTAHVADAGNYPVPGQTAVYLLRSSSSTPILMTDAGSGNYTASVPPAGGPISETLTAVDHLTTGDIASSPQTLVTASSNADCAPTGGLTFSPTSILADGQTTSTATAIFSSGSASGEPVVFTGDPGLNIVAASPTTDNSGVATATVHSGYSIGTKNVTVTDPNSLMSCSAALTITNGTPGTPGPGQVSRFIYRAYQDVLHRVGEAAGVEYNGNFVNFGGSRGQVALAFTTTTEYLTDVVNGTYQTYLGRPGDSAGVTYWVGQIANGGSSDEKLAALFIASDEFYANHGGTDSTWIDGLYQAVLGRSADSAGKASWLYALQHGWSRSQVANSFTDSTEQLTGKVIGYYSTFLHRAPSSSNDVSYWVNQMQNGVHDENVMASFIGSQEYFDIS